jgi:glycosyltransferase involved in cell wall biosynthesis
VFPYGFDVVLAYNTLICHISNDYVHEKCVDTEVFKITPDNSKKEKVILVPRNISHDRGIHLAIESFNIFNKINPDFKMLIVGSGTGKYYEYCKGLVAKYALNEKVIFIGQANRDEMINHYNTSLITLIPTLDKEGTSLSALESMSCGTATIVTDIAGLKDLPAHKTNPDPESVAKSIIEVLSDVDKFSTEQRQNVLENFNIKLWEKSFLNIIETIKLR